MNFGPRIVIFLEKKEVSMTFEKKLQGLFWSFFQIILMDINVLLVKKTFKIFSFSSWELTLFLQHYTKNICSI